MAKKGTSLNNPGTGESITWIRTAAETQGKYVTVVLKVGPHPCDRSKYINLFQEQSIQVKEGVMRLCNRSNSRLFLAGGPLHIKRGSASCWCNGSSEKMLTVEMTLSPAFQADAILEREFQRIIEKRDTKQRIFSAFSKVTMFQLSPALRWFFHSASKLMVTAFLKFIQRL